MVSVLNPRLTPFSAIFIATSLLAGCGKDADTPHARPPNTTVALSNANSNAGRVAAPKPIDEMNRAERVAFVQ